MIWVSDYYKQLFGSKVYKISLDAGCTCPNRDGSKGWRGCSFCSAKGSGDFTPSRQLPLDEQIAQAKQRVDKKAKGRSGSNRVKYIAYFQNFTNTYGNEDYLIDLFTQVLSFEDIVGISIATRPDCLSDTMLLKIAALCDRTYVSLELGLQTSNDVTAKKIHRCYETYVYEDAVQRIKQADRRIHIVTHIIFGLPGEAEQDMINTVLYTIKCGTDGIKITVLHILEGSQLAFDYKKGLLACMSQESYFAVLKKVLPLIPSDMVVHRLTGDGPKSILLAPLWTANKRKVHNDLMQLCLHVQD
ncbi:MAG: TIGR01212 family radical SAM protein [Treponema sp.]|nr:TIGR01212 family radical SAM protein [Treponema sp.]